MLADGDELGGGLRLPEIIISAAASSTSGQRADPPSIDNIESQLQLLKFGGPAPNRSKKRAVDDTVDEDDTDTKMGNLLDQVARLRVLNTEYSNNLVEVNASLAEAAQKNARLTSDLIEANHALVSLRAELEYERMKSKSLANASQKMGAKADLREEAHDEMLRQLATQESRIKKLTVELKVARRDARQAESDYVAARVEQAEVIAATKMQNDGLMDNVQSLTEKLQAAKIELQVMKSDVKSCEIRTRDSTAAAEQKVQSMEVEHIILLRHLEESKQRWQLEREATAAASKRALGEAVATVNEEAAKVIRRHVEENEELKNALRSLQNYPSSPSNTGSPPSPLGGRGAGSSPTAEMTKAERAARRLRLRMKTEEAAKGEEQARDARIRELETNNAHAQGQITRFREMLKAAEDCMEALASQLEQKQAEVLVLSKSLYERAVATASSIPRPPPSSSSTTGLSGISGGSALSTARVRVGRSLRLTDQHGRSTSPPAPPMNLKTKPPPLSTSASAVPAPPGVLQKITSFGENSIDEDAASSWREERAILEAQLQASRQLVEDLRQQRQSMMRELAEIQNLSGLGTKILDGTVVTRKNIMTIGGAVASASGGAAGAPALSTVHDPKTLRPAIAEQVRVGAKALAKEGLYTAFWRLEECERLLEIRTASEASLLEKIQVLELRAEDSVRTVENRVRSKLEHLDSALKQQLKRGEVMESELKILRTKEAVRASIIMVDSEVQVRPISEHAVFVLAPYVAQQAVDAALASKVVQARQAIDADITSRARLEAGDKSAENSLMLAEATPEPQRRPSELHAFAIRAPIAVTGSVTAMLNSEDFALSRLSSILSGSPFELGNWKDAEASVIALLRSISSLEEQLASSKKSNTFKEDPIVVPIDILSGVRYSFFSSKREVMGRILEIRVFMGENGDSLRLDACDQDNGEEFGFIVSSARLLRCYPDEINRTLILDETLRVELGEIICGKVMLEEVGRGVLKNSGVPSYQLTLFGLDGVVKSAVSSLSSPILDSLAPNDFVTSLSLLRSTKGNSSFASLLRRPVRQSLLVDHRFGTQRSAAGDPGVHVAVKKDELVYMRRIVRNDSFEKDLDKVTASKRLLNKMTAKIHFPKLATTRLYASRDEEKEVRQERGTEEVERVSMTLEDEAVRSLIMMLKADRLREHSETILLMAEEKWQIKHERIIKKRNRAAIVIQCAFRIHRSYRTLVKLRLVITRVRARHKRLKEREDRIRNKAALKIQTRLRVFLAKQAAIRRRQAYEAEIERLRQDEIRRELVRKARNAALVKLQSHFRRVLAQRRVKLLSNSRAEQLRILAEHFRVQNLIELFRSSMEAEEIRQRDIEERERRYLVELHRQRQENDRVNMLLLMELQESAAAHLRMLIKDHVARKAEEDKVEAHEEHRLIIELEELVMVKLKLVLSGYKTRKLLSPRVSKSFGLRNQAEDPSISPLPLLDADEEAELQGRVIDKLRSDASIGLRALMKVHRSRRDTADKRALDEQEELLQSLQANAAVKMQALSKELTARALQARYVADELADVDASLGHRGEDLETALIAEVQADATYRLQSMMNAQLSRKEEDQRHLVEQRLRLIKRLEEDAVVKLQEMTEGHLMRKTQGVMRREEASARVQAIVRGKAARRQAEEMRLEKMGYERREKEETMQRGAKTIQAAVRGHWGRQLAKNKKLEKQLYQLRLEHEAACWASSIKIQAVERGRQARKRVFAMKKAIADNIYAAAAKIQSMARGRAAREEFKRMMVLEIELRLQSKVVVKRQLEQMKMNSQESRGRSATPGNHTPGTAFMDSGASSRISSRLAGARPGSSLEPSTPRPYSSPGGSSSSRAERQISEKQRRFDEELLNLSVNQARRSPTPSSPLAPRSVQPSTLSSAHPILSRESATPFSAGATPTSDIFNAALLSEDALRGASLRPVTVHDVSQPREPNLVNFLINQPSFNKAAHERDSGLRPRTTPAVHFSPANSSPGHSKTPLSSSLGPASLERMRENTSANDGDISKKIKEEQFINSQDVGFERTSGDSMLEMGSFYSFELPDSLVKPAKVQDPGFPYRVGIRTEDGLYIMLNFWKPDDPSLYLCVTALVGATQGALKPMAFSLQQIIAQLGQSWVESHNSLEICSALSQRLTARDDHTTGEFTLVLQPESSTSVFVEEDMRAATPGRQIWRVGAKTPSGRYAMMQFFAGANSSMFTMVSPFVGYELKALKPLHISKEQVKNLTGRTDRIERDNAEICAFLAPFLAIVGNESTGDLVLELLDYKRGIPVGNPSENGELLVEGGLKLRCGTHSFVIVKKSKTGRPGSLYFGVYDFGSSRLYELVAAQVDASKSDIPLSFDSLRAMIYRLRLRQPSGEYRLALDVQN